jgi:uncharacterized protein YdhG (YjbR/CyaY superfamily)
MTYHIPLRDAAGRSTTNGQRTASTRSYRRRGLGRPLPLGDPRLRTVRQVGTVDDYFSDLDTETRSAFERIRSLALEIAPDVDQGTSYGMAALKYKQKPLLGFAAAKRHLSIFPFSPQVIGEVRDRLTGFELSKGTIRFSVDKPLPDDVVRDVVELRVAEIDGSRR